MVKVPLATTEWRRLVADEAEVFVKNRYFEENPTNQEGGSSLLSRPGLKRWLTVGTGPITQLFSTSGVFDDALFVASDQDLYRVDINETVTLIQAGAFTNGANGTPEFAATAPIGDTPAFLYATDGGVLWLYTENGYARTVLTATGTITVGDVVRIDGVYYSIQTSSLDTGSPAGTSGNPWKVQKGASNAATIQNLYNAINATGVAGTDYSTALTAHTTATAFVYTSTTVSIRAKTPGTVGNAIVTTETSAGLAFTGGTMAGGGSPSATQVVMPDDVGAVSLAFIAGFVIVIPVQDDGLNGRFYWIEPGATTIDPLNFATAEKSPDGVFQVRTMGDQFWLFGAQSTEIWYPTGTADLPFKRVQGRAFERGVWNGTAIQIKDAVMLVDNTGVVYMLQGDLKRVSNNSIEEQIRDAIRDEVIG